MLFDLFKSSVNIACPKIIERYCPKLTLYVVNTSIKLHGKLMLLKLYIKFGHLN